MKITIKKKPSMTPLTKICEFALTYVFVIAIKPNFILMKPNREEEK
jgi:hypothetical protein